MRHSLGLALVVLAMLNLPARGQLLDHYRLERVNRRIAGRVVDFTHNHGADRRIFSPILGKPRDLYVYLPPGYSPTRAYPIVTYLHLSAVDEHFFVGSDRVRELDAMIVAGMFPPVIVAIPDGLIEGENRFQAPHSLFLNGVAGRFEDHLLFEVIPFLKSRYSVRPEREASTLLGTSAGGMGAASIALRHPDQFGAVAIVGAPLNLLFDTCSHGLKDDFDPATYRWKTTYDPNEVVATFYAGLRRVRAKKYLEPVFGTDIPGMPGRIAQVNPTNLVAMGGTSPYRPAIYVNAAGKDNYNFDAQAASFVWFARSQGYEVDFEIDDNAKHNLPYFSRNHIRAFQWLARHIAPAADLIAPSPIVVPAQ